MRTKCIFLFPAPAIGQGAVGLVTRLIDTIKQRLSCVEDENQETISFNIKAALQITI